MCPASWSPSLISYHGSFSTPAFVSNHQGHASYDGASKLNVSGLQIVPGHSAVVKLEGVTVVEPSWVTDGNLKNPPASLLLLALKVTNSGGHTAEQCVISFPLTLL